MTNNKQICPIALQNALQNYTSERFSASDYRTIESMDKTLILPASKSL